VSHGTSSGFESFAAGNCDVAMASRQIVPAERARLRSFGDMTSASAEHVIGLDGIVIVVNRANPVSALSIPEIRRIFGAQVDDWSAVHGRRGRIDVYAPTVNTGTIDSLKLLAMGNVPFASSTRHVPTVADVAQAVARDPEGVGFVALPYASGVKRLSVEFGTERLAPDQINVSREWYPLSRRLYLYTSPRMSAPVKAFIEYVQSDEGQLNVDRAGFVGSTKPPSPPPRRVPVGAPPRYAQLVRTTQQSEFVFYFKTGSDYLDNKALVDIGRLVEAMHEPANRGQQIILAGFADSTGTHERNRDLSFARARSVQRELTARHVSVKEALGFGDAMPIRDNSTPEGREKNRRVEIFVTFKPS
jgi:phosphate transport system substrate-binding protein